VNDRVVEQARIPLNLNAYANVLFRQFDFKSKDFPLTENLFIPNDLDIAVVDKSLQKAILLHLSFLSKFKSKIPIRSMIRAIYNLALEENLFSNPNISSQALLDKIFTKFFSLNLLLIPTRLPIFELLDEIPSDSSKVFIRSEIIYNTKSIIPHKPIYITKEDGTPISIYDLKNITSNIEDFIFSNFIIKDPDIEASISKKESMKKIIEGGTHYIPYLYIYRARDKWSLELIPYSKAYFETPERLNAFLRRKGMKDSIVIFYLKNTIVYLLFRMYIQRFINSEIENPNIRKTITFFSNGLGRFLEILPLTLDHFRNFRGLDGFREDATSYILNNINFDKNRLSQIVDHVIKVIQNDIDRILSQIMKLAQGSLGIPITDSEIAGYKIKSKEESQQTYSSFKNQPIPEHLLLLYSLGTFSQQLIDNLKNEGFKAIESAELTLFSSPEFVDVEKISKAILDLETGSNPIADKFYQILSRTYLRLPNKDKFLLMKFISDIEYEDLFEVDLDEKLRISEIASSIKKKYPNIENHKANSYAKNFKSLIEGVISSLKTKLGYVGSSLEDKGPTTLGGRLSVKFLKPDQEFSRNNLTIDTYLNPAYDIGVEKHPISQKSSIQVIKEFDEKVRGFLGKKSISNEDFNSFIKIIDDYIVTVLVPVYTIMNNLSNSIEGSYSRVPLAKVTMRGSFYDLIFEGYSIHPTLATLIIRLKNALGLTDKRRDLLIDLFRFSLAKPELSNIVPKEGPIVISTSPIKI